MLDFSISPQNEGAADHHPDQTLQRLKLLLPALGITRVAEQTGLDRIGVPCFAAFRPNSRTLSVHQGKGLTAEHAILSAVMEAAEYAMAEAPQVGILAASTASLNASSTAFIAPDRFMPMGFVNAPNHTLSWVRGTDLLTGRDHLVPFDCVSMTGSARELEGICQHSNGLAAAFDEQDANFHALCELIERDANTFWSFLTPEEQQARCIDPATFDDAILCGLCRAVEQSGLSIRLFHQVSPLGVPVVLAVTGPADPEAAFQYFDLAAGAGCHPVPALAARRAVLEAIQTRITSISAGRDDFDPQSYCHGPEPLGLELLAAEPQNHFSLSPMPCRAEPAVGGVRSWLTSLLEHLSSKDIGPIVSVPFGDTTLGISVVRLIAPDLEDRGPNFNWWPGQRAAAHLLDRL